jgi:hypothetical protein
MYFSLCGNPANFLMTLPVRIVRRLVGSVDHGKYPSLRRTGATSASAVSGVPPSRAGETAIGVRTLFSGMACHAYVISFA